LQKQFLFIAVVSSAYMAWLQYYSEHLGLEFRSEDRLYWDSSWFSSVPPDKYLNYATTTSFFSCLHTEQINVVVTFSGKFVAVIVEIFWWFWSLWNMPRQPYSKSLPIHHLYSSFYFIRLHI